MFQSYIEDSFVYLLINLIFILYPAVQFLNKMKRLSNDLQIKSVYNGYPDQYYLSIYLYHFMWSLIKDW